MQTLRFRPQIHPSRPLAANPVNTEENTPIPPLPSLLPFLRNAAQAVAPMSSSPLISRGRRVYRARSTSPVRGSSEPAADSPRVILEEHKTSDDIIFTPRAEKRFVNARAQLKRQETRVATRMQKEIDKQAEQEAEQDRLQAAEQLRLLARNVMFDRFLEEMKTKEASMADFMEYVFDPENKFNTDWRWKGFFAQRPQVLRIFGHWTTSKYNATTRAFMDEWATDHVSKKVYTEARSITNSGILSKAKKVVNEQFFLDFNLATLTQTLRSMAPFAFAIFDAFSDTARQLTQTKHTFKQRKEIMKGTAALTLLRGRSQKNNYPQAVTGTYLAATGGQRQHYSVLSLYGFSMGYASIISRSTAKAPTEEENVADATAEKAGTSDSDIDIDIDDEAPALLSIGKNKRRKNKKNKPQDLTAGNAGNSDSDNDIDDEVPALARIATRKQRHKNKKNKKFKKRKRIRGPGLFSVLHDACMDTTRTLAASRLTTFVYDNVNLMNRIAEQILGRKSAQENGTCATVIPLHNAKLEHLLTSELDKSILAARQLTVDDITLNANETKFFVKNMVHTILRTILLHGGEGFQKWKKDVDASQPVSKDTIDVHKTPLHPLPAMEIYESSITGNVEVIEEIMRVLGFKSDDPDYAKYIQLIAGDQLTIAHCHGVLETHFGKPTFRSPGSLGFHNTVLDRLPITLTSLPPFRTCRDLIMVSLYARVLHCLLLVSKKDSLEACAESIDSYNTLVSYAQQIYSTYTDVDRVQELRERRQVSFTGRQQIRAAAAHPQGDMVYENTVLFLRDALLTREFSDAIKDEDSGRILIILRMWAFCYRGNGRTKYAHEMLHLLHNLICVWTKELRYTVLQNWLGNPQGKARCFVEIDLIQEHLNLWIKKIYKADGAGHSWDWLALISPCVDILRQLATKINVDLGARQGSKHATPDLEDDIDTLMDSLAEHDVYVETEGRVLDDDEKPAPDVYSVGAAALTHGSLTTPLADFNAAFEVLRARRDLTSVSDLLPLIPIPGDAATASVMAAAVASSNASAESDITDSDLPSVEAADGSDDELETGEPEHPEEEEDLFAESPTLTRFDEGDVELDMDDIPEWYLDDEEESESDSDEE
ncbi:hypothetical protein DFH06DRAFT_1133343 [Mycena polygramma]|nr:hypothetical protein DFH06DRAFT_1133343 [Mycena polygramma]